MTGHMRTRYDWPGMSDRTRRQIEKLRSLQVAITIRDSPGDGSPATDKVRLDAIKRIAPKSVRVGLRHAAPVSGGLRAGYVIVLPASDPPAVDGVAIEPDE
jgi:hypothetical protein